MNHYRTIFLSDLHLGGACCYSGLLDFLKNNNADQWYIVGDFLGLWEVRRSKQWPREANLVIQKILRKIRKGAQFTILVGNHDSELHHLKGLDFAGLTILDKAIFQAGDGRRFLVLHGDVLDPVIGHAKWLAQIGSVLYDFLVQLNSGLNSFRKLFHLPFWSFSAAIKKTVKHTISYVSDFEESLIELARQSETDGVICGHIHTPAVKQIDGLMYINCGDWVESLTAIVEHPNGRLELKYYDH